jgi:putative phage-type endonuclease
MIELPAGKILGPYENRDDWLEARKQGIGGSDVAALLGLSTFTSPLQVFYEKTEGATREVTERMEIGQAIEKWILEFWESTSGVWVDELVTLYDEQIIIKSDEYPWLLHSPDALVTEWDDHLNPAGKALAGIEIKNIGNDHHWDPLPPFYMAQVQHGLLCSGLDKWIVIALVGGSKLITREVSPDLEMQGRIITESERFWNDHVLANIPPDPDGSEVDSRALDGRWEASQSETIEIADYWLRNLKQAKQTLDNAEKGYAKVCQRIKVLMGDAEKAVTVDGAKVATWKVSTRTAIDTKRLRDEDPEVAKKYEKTSPTRIFRPTL